jgi:hypothetical protein
MNKFKSGVLKCSIVLLILGISFFPSIKSNEIINQNFSTICLESSIDINFIYNVTENLSNIIFDVYNESNGEIAKGRAFGTKGEHVAGEYLIKTMDEIGLWSYKEKLCKRYPGDFITSKVDVLDYNLQVSNSTKSLNVACNPRVLLVSLDNIKSLSNVDLNFSYSNVKLLNKHPSAEKDTEKYVFLKEEPVQNFTFNGMTILEYYLSLIKPKISGKSYPNMVCQLKYFSNPFKDDDVYDQNYAKNLCEPRFFINETIGNMLNESIKNNNIDNYTVSFNLTQVLNTSVESFNVIGQINGSNPFKTVIVGCLYDSWWNQGTADSAIGIGIMLSIAKYFIENDIKPRYNLKFIGYSGEEHGCKGSIFYESKHKFENIKYIIDLNQLGFEQENPGCRMEVCSNSKRFLSEIWGIIEKSDYLESSKNVSEIVPIISRMGHLSDDRSFALRRPFFLPFRGVKTLCFLKNGQWLYHHRTSEDNTKGDAITQFDYKEVKATADMILDVTRYIIDKSYIP